MFSHSGSIKSSPLCSHSWCSRLGGGRSGDPQGSGQAPCAGGDPQGSGQTLLCWALSQECSGTRQSFPFVPMNSARTAQPVCHRLCPAVQLPVEATNPLLIEGSKVPIAPGVERTRGDSCDIAALGTVSCPWPARMHPQSHLEPETQAFCHLSYSFSLPSVYICLFFFYLLSLKPPLNCQDLS